LADSPIGAFYLPNLILFYFFPMPIAFNLHYILIFLASTIGTYLLCQYYRLSKPASLYAALAYGFSGFFVARVIHTSFIQLASLLPFLFLIIEKYIEKKEKKYLFIFALFINQSIFIGYLQSVIYILIALNVYLTAKLYLQKYKMTRILKYLGILGLFSLFGFALSAVQILPTYEMLKVSSRSSGLNSNQLFINSGSTKILSFFLNPFIYGNISKGTFKESTDLGIYWENIAYSGILTPILALIAYFVIKKNRQTVAIFTGIMIFSLLMALGKYSPLHIFFDIPPLSYFRIPARFLFITSFSISIMAAFTIDKIEKNKKLKILGVIVLIIISLDIFKNWYNFNTITPFSKFTKEPDSLSYLKDKNLQNFRTASLWSYLFTPTHSQGQSWEQQNDAYLYNFFKLSPDVNMIFNIPTADSYTSLSTNRTNLFRNLYGSNLELNNPENIKLNSKVINLLRLQSIKYLLTTYDLKDGELQEVYASQKYSKKYTIYELKNAYPRIRLVNNTKTVKTISDLEINLASDTIDFKDTALIEKTIEPLKKKFASYEISNIKDSGSKLTFQVVSNGDAYLLVSDSFYPGWKAKIDNKLVEIFAANGNSRLIYIPEGKHNIIFYYLPNSLKAGALISGFSYLFLLLLLIFNKRLKLVQRITSTL